MNASKELLEMRLNDDRVRGLAQDLQQVIITNKIETREYGTLLLFNEKWVWSISSAIEICRIAEFKEMCVNTKEYINPFTYKHYYHRERKPRRYVG